MMLSFANILTLVGFFHLSMSLPSESHLQQRGAFSLVKSNVTTTVNTVDTRAVAASPSVYFCEDINWGGPCEHFVAEDRICCKS